MSISTYRGKSRTGGTTPMFISKWDTTLVFDDVGDRVDPPNSPDNTIVLPLTSDGSYDFYVDWGDGNRDNITAYNQSEVTHQYSNTGIYEIRIRGGITGWQFKGVGDDDKILEISNWGPLRFISDDTDLFNGCSNLDVVATDSLTLGASNGQTMFSACTNLGNQGNMSNWNTSNATTMNQTFAGADTFNKVLDNWDTSNVTIMFRMFGDCTSFNNGGSTGINNWNTSNVTDMRYMFYFATGFNQPIGSWDVGSVTHMSFMFSSATSFNQDIGNWDTSNVTSMQEMFKDADQFNNGGSDSISGWDTSNLTNMSSMFKECTGFNQPIGNWNTSSLFGLNQTFYNADAFDQDLSNWVVTGVINATNFMLNANGLSTTNYDRTLSGWSSQAVQNGVNIHFGGSQYSTATGLAYKNALVASGWTITDGGSV